MAFNLTVVVGSAAEKSSSSGVAENKACPFAVLADRQATVGRRRSASLLGIISFGCPLSSATAATAALGPTLPRAAPFVIEFRSVDGAHVTHNASRRR